MSAPAPSFPGWVPDAVFYQVFPDRFCNGDRASDPPGAVPWDSAPTRENFFGGDLQGVLDKLDYLQDLGINALYLNPIFKARTNHKYDTEDYFQVDPAFGTNALLKELVAEIHRRGMHVILDGVFNHCGAEFPPFRDLAQNGPQSAYRDWFLVRSFPIRKEPLSYMTCGGADYLPKLNHANPAVLEFILKVARYWVEEAGIDGWRLDVPFKIPFNFWRQFRQALPGVYLVGEIWREAGPWVQGDIFDGATNYRLRELLLDYCLTDVLDGEDFGFETQMLSKAHGPASRAMLNLLGSHDTARIFTVLGGDLGRLKVALTYVMTAPGAALVYYGDEVGLQGETDPGCRRAMPWDAPHWQPEVTALYRRLIALRHAHPALRRGERRSLFTFNGAFAYRMSLGEDEVIVALNPRESLPGVNLPVESVCPAWKDAETGKMYALQGGKLELGDLPARSAQVLVKAR